jgi:hypothetical protein
MDNLTVDQLISQLSALKASLGGDTPVFLQAGERAWALSTTSPGADTFSPVAVLTAGREEQLA